MEKLCTTTSRSSGTDWSRKLGAQAVALGALRGVQDTRVPMAFALFGYWVPGLLTCLLLGFATPLGEIPLDRAAIDALSDLPQIVVSDAAHAQEHSLEVQLPFLQSVLGNFTLLPLAVGDATPAEVAQVLDALWGGDETLIVISSDLSHFLPYATAQRVDLDTLQIIKKKKTTLNHQQACGATPVNGLLLAAQRHHLQPTLLGLCNSGDTAGDKGRVVGYAALVLTPGENHAH